MKEPSTGWLERIAPDEDAHFARVGEVIARLQRTKSAKFGRGRALHRKQVFAATGTLEVLPGLPAHARHGLFAAPGPHRALVRLSNGGPDVQANKRPDIRGFSVKVLDVSGEGALGSTTDHQDLLMINQDHFASADWFVLLRWTPIIKNNWNWFTQLELLSSMDIESNKNLVQRVRLGLGKKSWQFGLASDQTQTGNTNLIATGNNGFFYERNFSNFCFQCKQFKTTIMIAEQVTATQKVANRFNELAKAGQFDLR